MDNLKFKLENIVSPFLLVFVPIGIVACIYWPGLTGTFLFDDFVNLGRLGHINNTDTYQRIVQFVFTGGSGPTGRPISLLSFMINDTAWPTSAWSFIYTNLMIHLLNGALVFLFIYKLFNITGTTEKRSRWIACLASLLWLIHPLHISTVLYVIQRMTELSTLFCLTALICYLYGRERISISTVNAYLIMTAGIVIFGILAILSKENGVLLLLYIVVIEFTFMRPMGKIPPNHFKYWMTFFIYLPLGILSLYFIITHESISAAYADRPFTLDERLLTQCRVVFDYLYQVFLPQLGGSGVFHDDYPISRNLISPPQTLASLLAIALIITSAFRFRKKFPIYSFSVFWFFAGHMLESTFLPLELYIEHRNYLPTLGPVIGLAYAALITTGIVHRLLIIGITCLGVLFAFITFNNAQLWGNPALATPVWAAEHPASIRAQQTASAIAIQQGDSDKARSYITSALDKYPRDSGLLLQVLLLDCENNSIDPKYLNKLLLELPSSNYSNAAIETLITLHSQVTRKRCDTLNNEALREIFKALINNKDFQNTERLHMLYFWLGQLYADALMLTPAIESLDEAQKHMNAIDIPLLQAVWLISAGLNDDALLYVKKARDTDARIKNPFLKHVRKNDIDNLEKIILFRTQKIQ